MLDSSAQMQTAIPLWPGGAPGALGNSSNDIPTLTPYLPDPASASGAAFVICPGGAYQNICTNWRFQLDKLLQDGFVVFMLKYRTEPGWVECEKYSLLDAKRAIRFIRTYAQHYGVDPDRIGVAGADHEGRRQFVQRVAAR